jgi:sec-independent protein translocase protein TatA
MFGISGEHMLILGIVLLIFGPRRLPELGNTLGKAMRNFKDAISGVEEAKFRHLAETKPESSPGSAKAAPQAPASQPAGASLAAEKAEPTLDLGASAPLDSPAAGLASAPPATPAGDEKFAPSPSSGIHSA